MPDLSKPWCYYVPAAQDVDQYGGYVPSLVIEGDPLTYPMLGQGRFASPWVWGRDHDEAQRIAAQVNARRGITEEQAAKIVASSITASLRGRRYKPS